MARGIRLIGQEAAKGSIDVAREHGLTAARERRVVAAIKAAEVGHRGEIRVHVETRYTGDGPSARARQLFDALDMNRTTDGTGVLLYVATHDRKAAVWAGPGVYGGADPGFWASAVDAVANGWRDGDPASGLCAAIAQIGALLVEAAAGRDTAGDELPNSVTTS